MRGTRWLLLVAIAAILTGVGATYRAKIKAIRASAPTSPQPLPNDLRSSSAGWDWSETDANNHLRVEIHAEGVREQKDSSRVDLDRVRIKTHNKNGLTYDLVECAAASFFKSENRLYSDGEVHITLDIPEQGQPKHQLVTVKSSGVTFDTTSQHVDTDRAAEFTFENGDGAATGASYNSLTHELVLKGDVRIDRKAAGPKGKAMRIEGASLAYHESTAEVWLKPWGRLTRGDTVVEGEQVVVHLEDRPADDGETGKHKRIIRMVEASNAHGTGKQPHRNLQYSAKQLWVNYTGDGIVEKITGQDQAHLLSTSETASTEVAADHVDLNFDPDVDGVLTHVGATGHGVVTSKPLPAPNRQMPESHVLRSENFEMKMREGGRDIENVVTHGPGTIEFLPNAPLQHRRTLDGDNLVIAYGAQNRLDSFRATNVKTRTEPTEEERKKNRVASITASREMTARFDPRSSRMASMEQTGDFTYEEGDRNARAAKATMDSEKNTILLDTGARVWDATGSTAADRIHLDQSNGNFTADGNVQSSRLPDKDKKKNSEMLSGDDPLQAQARKMVSTNRNRTVHYEGAVSMRQGANQITADTIDLDREKHTLVADGKVVTRLWDEKSKPPILTVTNAQHLVYTEPDRQAVYTGGTSLTRANMRVKSESLRAFLAEAGGDSRLEKAFADGAVEIVQTAKPTVRTGTGGHAEYYTEDQRIVLNGGRPKMVEMNNGRLKDSTEGEELTYFANDDRLLVNGSLKQPAGSILQRKK
jgi:lipopolysaccharide export system protein LptA